jgi:nucleoside 2-deoxyribosyltransferase
MRIYVAGPLFSEAERAWLDGLAARLRAEAFDCFVPHEHFGEAPVPTAEAIFRIDADALRACDVLVAWLDGPMVDDGTACEIGMFAQLGRAIVGIATDLRLERRRERGVAGGGMNLFVAGAIESCGSIVHDVDAAVAVLRAL